MFDLNEFANGLSFTYKYFCEKSLNHRRVKHSDIVPLIDFIKGKNIFTVTPAGQSIQGRDIFVIGYGKGKKKIFLWSQMHGDETTATMALFDIFNFFLDDKHFNEIKNLMFNRLKIYFLPMVNPDGSEIHQRRNAHNIDLNRDANRLQSPEARILMKVFKNTKPHFGFNLHDQNIHYAVGSSFMPASISLLAPPIDNRNTMTDSRNSAIKLIVDIYSLLKNFIPGHVGRYPDEFELRAFGDSFQKAGMSTILIESGGWKDDSDKKFLRKINFIILLTSFLNIAQEYYKKADLKIYDLIPENKEIIFDLLLKNLKFVKDGKETIIDLGINLEEIQDDESPEIFYQGKLADMGDLSVFHGYEDIDLSGYEVRSGMTYPETIDPISEISKLDLQKLYREGYTSFVCPAGKFNQSIVKYPVNVQASKEIRKNIEIDQIADYIILKDNKVNYVIINGFLFNVISNSGEIKNGAVLS